MAGLFFYTEKMKEGVSAESEANGFQGNDLLWRDVAQVYICAQEFDKPNLLGLCGASQMIFSNGIFVRISCFRSR